MMKMDEHSGHEETIMTAPSAPSTTRWSLTRVLLAVGAAGPIVFLAVATLLGLLDPAYDVMSEPVSALAWRPNGWAQTANFYAFGLSVVVFGLGLYCTLAGRGRLAAAILLTISGLALIAAGVFPGTPPGAEPTVSGLIHGLAFFWTFIPLPTAYALAALRLQDERGWRGHALYTAALPSVVFGLVVVYGVLGSDPGDPLLAVGGLIQRALLVAAFGWITITAGRLLTSKARRGDEPPGS